MFWKTFWVFPHGRGALFGRPAWTAQNRKVAPPFPTGPVFFLSLLIGLPGKSKKGEATRAFSRPRPVAQTGHLVRRDERGQRPVAFHSCKDAQIQNATLAAIHARVFGMMAAELVDVSVCVGEANAAISKDQLLDLLEFPPNCLARAMRSPKHCVLLRRLRV
jgi:hypothetical protein